MFKTPSSSKTLGSVFSQGMKIRTKRKSVSVTNKRKKIAFRLPKIIDDPLVLYDITESFKSSFFAKGMKYTTELVYDSKDCPESMNDPKREGKV